MIFAFVGGVIFGGLIGVGGMALLVASNREMPPQIDDAEFYNIGYPPAHGMDARRPPERM